MTGEPRLFVLGSYVTACCATVERLPRSGDSLIATSFSSESGGKGFNVAVGARRLGAMVDCLVAVGDDDFARLAEPAFIDAGVSVVLRRYAGPTGAGIGFIGENGENCLAVCPGANLKLSAGDVHALAALVRRATMVLAQFEIGDAPIRAAFRLAREAGRLTLLNPSPFRLPSADILADTTILVVNEREADALAAALGLAPTAAFGGALAAVLHDRGVALLVITRGANGAVAMRRDRDPLHQAAFDVDARDTLGAGDAFVAALATGLAAGSTLEDAMRRAAAAGALMAMKPGTVSAFPTAAEIDGLIAAGRLLD